MEHILGLAEMVCSAARREPVNQPTGIDEMSYAELRTATLQHLETASSLFGGLPADSLSRRPIVFERPDGSRSEVPVFTLIHGPLTDAIYHTGQIVTMRRAAGNPTNPRVSMFRGRLNQ